MSKPRHIGELIEPGGTGVSATLAHARKLQALDSILVRILQPGFAGQVRVANRKGATLLLVTPSAAIASRLRLEKAELARAMRLQGAGDIAEIEVRVAPLPNPARAVIKKRNLTPAARAALGVYKDE